MLKKKPHTQLTDVHKEILVKHYDEARVSSVDQLPYTEAIERIKLCFNRDTGLSLTEGDIWRALKNLGRQARLGRR